MSEPLLTRPKIRARVALRMALGSACAAPGAAAAIELTQQSDALGEVRFDAAPHAYYMQLSSTGSGIGRVIRAGPGLEAGMEVAVANPIALGVGLRQSYEVSASPKVIYTALELRAQFALSGGFRSLSRQLFLDQWQVVRSTEALPSGFRIGLSLSQLYFDSKKTIFPFSAIGANVAYELPATERLSLSAGIGYDLGANAEARLQVIRLFAKLIHPL